MTDDLSNLGLEFSEDWVPFPTAGSVDLDSWAKQQGQELAERYAQDGAPCDARRLARSLKRTVADCYTRDPLAAFGWYVSGHETVAAIMELDAIHPDETFPEVSLSLLAEHMTSHDFGEPDVREVRLPLGDAVRIRQNLIGEKKGFFGPRPVVHTVFYGVRPHGLETALTMLVSWTEPILDEPAEQMADNIAKTLSL
ncbi:hypothetical protein ACWDAO_33635 [Streptomyces sp. NPDC001212]|uniref:hypothetical protein n=1 Tax=Streptomyces sp. HYC2 TaxID=2955207 RepID=UPI00248079EF|nr:hypothetical protein [Streptomyces sp. HYC2]